VRAHPRIAVVLAINLESDAHLVSGVVRNLSLGGIFVETHHMMPPRARVVAHLPITPEGGDVSLECEVCWCRPFDPLVPEEPPGLGLRFVEPPPEAVEALGAFFTSRTAPATPPGP
jgi:Tfp pilus assembly protein PilZ